MGEFKRKLEDRRRLARTLTPGEHIALIGGMPTRQMVAIPASVLIEQGKAAAEKARLKGKFDSNCNVTACQEPLIRRGESRNWFNTSTRAYYCTRCARRINEWPERRGEPPICVAVSDPTERPPFQSEGRT